MEYFVRSGDRIAVAVVALSLVVLGGGGCQSLTAPSSASFASVKIGGQTVEQVQATALKVFQDEGYRAAASSDGLLFEREGSRWEEIAQGSNIDNRKVINRVRAQIVDLGGGVCRLQCTAYVVRDAGTGVEDEIKLPPWKSGYYQNLLDKVPQRLSPVQIIQK
jgi:hypothetical protein